MNVTKTLMDEHQLILAYLDLLERYCAKAEAAGDLTVLTSKLSTFVDFITQFADRFHHGKEEDVLFAHLERPGVLTHCNPVGQMLHEHDLGRKHVEAMITAASDENLHELTSAIRSYCDLLGQHIHKEDMILYRMAEEGLTPDDKAAIAREYEAVEKRLGGETLWKTFKHHYDELSSGL